MTGSVSKRAMNFKIGGRSIRPGTMQRFEIPLVRLPSGTWLSLPLIVVNGAKPGPRLWITAAIHGDEINGIEIIHKVLGALDSQRMSGTLVAVPIVNVFGFIEETRYLPDRRDLNRCFPGSPSGSLAARIAHKLMREVIHRCEYGIDLHTATDHRINFPHIRGDLRKKETRRLAIAFGAPLVLHSRFRDGSLREAATARGIHTLLFEGGAPHRFNWDAISVGVAGVLRVMAVLGMHCPTRRFANKPYYLASASDWIRARRSGILRLTPKLGAYVHKGETLGTISDVLGEEELTIESPISGVVISFTLNPIIHQGEAIFHIAKAKAMN